jgi:hypothetical protein
MSDAGATYQYPFAHHPPLNMHEKSFQEALRDWLRSAPWFLVSMIIHLAAGLILANIDWRTFKEDDFKKIIAHYDPDEIRPLFDKPEKPKKKLIEEIDQVEDPPQPILADPVSPIVDDRDFDSSQPLADGTNIIGTGTGWVVGRPSGGSLQRRQAGSGGGPATQRAVGWALEWLSRHQDPEGFWDCDGFELSCSLNRCGGRGRALNDPGVTGLALLAFLGAGNTTHEGPHQKALRKGIRYLCDIQDPEDGCLTPKEGEHYMYNHAIACLALTEAYGLSRWPVLKKPAYRAIDYVRYTRNPGAAWRYNLGATDPLEQNDVSVTGWMIMCLTSAHHFGYPVDRKDVEEALAYIDAMTDSATGRTGYRGRGSFSSRETGDEALWPNENIEAMTAVGMLSRIFCSSILDNAGSQDRILEKGAALLGAKTPRWDEEKGTIDYYYWYYGSYVMFQMDNPHWKAWKKPMVEAIIEHQHTAGCERGSWDPRVDPWGDHGGRVYSTALCALCLEVFYRYDRILGARF